MDNSVNDPRRWGGGIIDGRDAGAVVAVLKRWAESVIMDCDIDPADVEGFGLFLVEGTDEIARGAKQNLGIDLNLEQTLVQLMWLVHRDGIVSNFDRNELADSDYRRFRRLMEVAHRSGNPRRAFRRLSENPLLLLEQVA